MNSLVQPIQPTLFKDTEPSAKNGVHMRIRVQKIRYQSGTGFAILVARNDMSTKDIVVKGDFLDPCEGSVYDIDGEWVEDKKWGKQIDVKMARPTMPSTEEGIRKFLASGLIYGIGEKRADLIVDIFGKDTINVIDKHPKNLLAIKGINEDVLEKLKDSWEAVKNRRDDVIFLMSLGVSAAYAGRICKKYGKDTQAVVKANPYILIDDVDGIGFTKADIIALNLGYDVKGEERIMAGIGYVLSQAALDGDCYLKDADLIKSASELLKVEDSLVADDLKTMIGRGTAKDNDHAIYLPKYFFAETRVAAKLVSLLHGKTKDIKLTDKFWKNSKIAYDEVQKEAIVKAMASKVMVLTGGPGTGKTTTTNGIIKAWESADLDILLAAPTGRAAKRMKEATGKNAMTIHRLLGYNPDTGWMYNEDSPLEGDALIVDEASMIDIELMEHLVSAIPDNMRLILVGDIDQLPSVGAGNVLRDVIASDVIPTVRLTRIFRQAATSHIITNAHLVNEGKMPKLDNTEKSDFFVTQNDDYLDIENKIVDLVTRRLPAYYHVTTDDIQVLTPMRRTNNGVQNLNTRLQAAINPVGTSVKFGDTIYRVGDKVMQIKNDYKEGIFNGDTGKVVDVNKKDGTVTVMFDDGPLVKMTRKMMASVCLSYATTIHKSQGSEYKVVVMPMTMQFFTMLQRNLLYTGITRAKTACVIIGQKKAISMAVRNNAVKKRNTLLKERIISEEKKWI
jgi:exodeoxyribonuclease V alpha subunit